MNKAAVYWMECIVVMTTGLAIGWFTQQWLYEPNTEQAALEPRLPEAPNSIAQAGQPEPATELNKNKPTTNNKGESTQPETAAVAFIEELSLMDDQTYIDYLNDSFAGKHSREFLLVILQELPTISDSTTWYRLVDFLGQANWRYFADGESPIEEWIFAQIKSVEPAERWLRVLSEFGVHKPENTEYLMNHLDSFQTPEIRALALLAIANKSTIVNGPGLGAKQKYISARMIETIAPYFDSKNEVERAAAIRVLRGYSSKNFTQLIARALKDKSERVRVSAVMALNGRTRTYNAEILRLLLSRMQADEAGALERVMAWQALKHHPLAGSQYEAVYEFEINDARRLQQLAMSSSDIERSQWGYYQ